LVKGLIPLKFIFRRQIVVTNQNLSLLKFCISCNASCCKIKGEFIGTPILSEDEVCQMQKITTENFDKIESPSGQSYWIIKEQKGTSRCFFLTKDNKCVVQRVKPLDCLCYPLKALHQDDSIVFVIDPTCPATEKLSDGFIQEAKKIAVKSILRFDQITYQHWLDNHIGWIKKAKRLN